MDIKTSFLNSDLDEDICVCVYVCIYVYMSELERFVISDQENKVRKIQ